MYGIDNSLPLYGQTTGTITIYIGGGITNYYLVRSSYQPARPYRSRRVRPAPRMPNVMACEGHRMPPVAIALCELPLPAHRPPSRAARASWWAWHQGGHRERASHRRRLRAWER
jgi:hypothetical protein